MREQARAALQLDGPRWPRIRSDMIGLLHCASLFPLLVTLSVAPPASRVGSALDNSAGGLTP